MKKKFIGPVIAILVVLAVIAFCILYGMGKIDFSKKTAKDRVYVEKVSSIMSGYSFAGNTYMGVVETQDTYSVQKASDREIAKTFVSVGDKVKKGDDLFEYTTTDLKTEITQLGYDIQNGQLDLKEMEEELEKAITERNKIGTAEDPLQDAFGTYGYETYESRRQEADTQIANMRISIQQKKNSIQSIIAQVTAAEEKIKNSKVTAGMDGIIQTINDGSSDTGNSNTNAYIVILAEGNYRIKGKVNEQNIYSVSEGMEVTVRSRVDRDKTWYGTISKVDTQPAKENNVNGYYYGSTGDSDNKSSNYPFYVSIDNFDDLLLGQHVYIELSAPVVSEFDKTEGIWIGEYYLEYDEESSPYVWVADSKMKLKKQKVELGQYDSLYGEYEILSGIEKDTYICAPSGYLYEGVRCVTNAGEVDYNAPMYNQNDTDGNVTDGDIMTDGSMTDGIVTEDVMTMPAAQ